MTRIHIIEPKVVSFTTTITVPTHKCILIPGNNDIYHWETTFIHLRDNAINDTEKSNWDRCRATLKWAYCCNASLEKISNSKDAYGRTIEFTFAFTQIDQLIEFVNKLRMNVSSAMM